ncbi:MAG: hypothetical protein COV47_04510 [Candidatus Diapherotrites archaeon CG11_big_fil_rev_8_21_14_0_20_37_9]|nr:MAG: hypothetical protein COV47_04510 [Candidatus Diapherotrites archaeon CG11_big_fil_rev_8_21_14_0_20_37_9]
MRFWEIDCARGIAITMMVLFHLLFDLNYLGIIEVSLYTGFWGLFQKATAGLFLFLTGVVLTISYNRNTENYIQKFLKRGATVFAVGIGITIVTALLFPNEFIYFGILHLIGVSIILSIPVAKGKILPFVAGIFLIALPQLMNIALFSNPLFVWTGLGMPWRTFDYFPVIPWFGVILFGISFGNVFYEKGIAKFKIVMPEIPGIRILAELGRKSLLIYLVHQPILFVLIFTAITLLGRGN